MTWQPIDTVPTNGTEVDLWCVTHTFADVALGHVRKITKRLTNAYWSPDLVGLVDSDGEVIDQRVWHVTHWMLSPKPPGDA
jgi:hypothetical protein